MTSIVPVRLLDTLEDTADLAPYRQRTENRLASTLICGVHF